MDVATYIGRYPPKLPAKAVAEPEDASRQLTSAEGVGELPACAASLVPGKPGQARARHLWVIVPEAVRVILETAPLADPPLSLGLAKHTNLTGGGAASCGGELWVDQVAPNKLYATGGSGRYPARTAQQLKDATDVIAHLGFEVVSAGWSDENDCAQRVFRW